MPVDPRKKRQVLVVHGVHTGADADQNQHRAIEALIRARLNGIPVRFACQMYRYENVNDAAQKKLRRLFVLLSTALTGQRLLSEVRGFSVDLIGDVTIALKNDATAATIRRGLRDRILEIFDKGHPLYLVAHSLGSVYALDVVNELMRDRALFDRNSRKTWPIQALVTLGSPLGLSMFRRNKVEKLGRGRHFFRWLNYWARTDPVVSGSLYGRPRQGYRIAGRFHTASEDSGWFIQDHVVDVGKVWLMAHTGYWHHAPIGDDLAALITT